MKKQYISPAIYGHKLCIESNILATSPKIIKPKTIQNFGHKNFVPTEDYGTQEKLSNKPVDFTSGIEEATGGGWESL